LRNGAATLLVLVHFAVLVAHGSAHSHLNISVSPWQKAFIAVVIFVAPLTAMLMLWTRVRKLGVFLLGLSLAGSLLFGAGYHFVMAGPDNALGPYHSGWESAFRATAVLLALIEATGLAWCIWLLHCEPSSEE
jgi:hypothetical protein